MGLRESSKGLSAWVAGLAWLAAASPSPATGGAPVALTGSYQSELGTVGLLQGEREWVVTYRASFPSAGGSVNVCRCAVAARREGGRLELDGPMKGVTLTLEAGAARLEGREPGCCGLGWPGRDRFLLTAPAPLLQCEVKSERASFHSVEQRPARRAAPLPAGSRVEVLPDWEGQRLLPARWKGPGGVRVGMVRRGDLACPALPRQHPETDPRK